MAAATLSAESSLGSSTPQLAFQTSDQCVVVSGQKLKFSRCDAQLDPDETSWYTGNSGHGIALVATCPKEGLFAFTERVLQPQIHICTYPDMMPMQSLAFEGALEFSAVSFLRSGNQIAALTGLPSPTLAVWSLGESVQLLASAPLSVLCDSLSFNPIGDGSLCTSSSKKMFMWSLRKVYETYLMDGTEVEFDPEDLADATTCAWNDHAWSGDALYAASESGTVMLQHKGQPAQLCMRLEKPVRAILTDATHATLGFADGTITWYALEDLDGEAPLFTITLGSSALRCLIPSPDFSSMLATTSDGETHLLTFRTDDVPIEPVANPKDVVDFAKITSFHTASVVAATVLPLPASESHDIVTCSVDGTLRCVDARTRLEVARIATSSSPSAVSACAASMLVAMGTSDGFLRLYQRCLEDAPVLRLGWKGFLGSAAVTKLAFTSDGTHLAASCADGLAVVLAFAPGATEPTVCSHFHTSSAPTSIAWTAAGKLLVALPDGKLMLISAADSAEPNTDTAPSIVLTSPAIAILEAPPQYEASSGGSTVVFAVCEDRSLCVYEVPQTGAVGQATKSLHSFTSHEKLPTSLAMSPDGAFIATGGKDGCVAVRQLASLNDAVTIDLHDSALGGITALALVPNRSPAAPNGSALVFSCGADSVMFMTTANPMIASVGVAPTYAPRQLALPELAEEPAGDAKPETVLEAAAALANASQLQSDARDALAAKVEVLRSELNVLLEANAKLDDDDLEKLTTDDFIIDLPQQKAWRAEGTRKVDALKAEIEESNLINELVSSRMSREFWTAMEAPASTLHAMPVPGASTKNLPKCGSFTVPQPKPGLTEALEKVKMLRRVELIVSQFEASDGGADAENPASCFEAAATFAQGIGRVLSASELAQSAAAGAAAAPVEGAEKKDDAGDGEEEQKDENSTADTSQTKLLYAPFELHPPWRKRTQMKLHGEVLHDLKTDFNNQLADMLNHKRGELDRIKEKQTRIREIESELARLKSESDGEPTDPIGLELDEEPAKLLEVNDNEIVAAKFISKEERARLDKLEAERKARELAEAGDTLGKRGLKSMMDGTLETRREEDEVFITLVKPEWMETKPPEEFTEEEVAMVAEFEAKEKKLDAEREKRSKGLLTELAKLRLDIADICKAFNERVVALRETKVTYDSAVYECELLTIRLGQACISADSFKAKSTALTVELKEATEALALASDKAAAFKEELAAQNAIVEEHKAEDKELDRAFRRDFADLPEFIEPLKKLFTRRKLVSVPKGAKTAEAEINKPPVKRTSTGGRAGAAMLVAVQTGENQRRTSTEGPAGGSTGRASARDPYASLDGPEMEQKVEPLDAAADMPEGLSFDVWDRLVEARDAKIASEEQLKVTTATLTQMSEYLALLTGEEDRLRNRVDELHLILRERREQELRGAWNLELPFKLKQGQVEVEEAAVVTDYGDALLVHRSEVCDLNKEIRKLGAEKVVILKEIRDFRKGIVYMQWESTKSDMEADDLVQKTKDFQLLRVTKDLQEKIRGGGEDNHAVENAALERKLEQLKASHEEKVADLRRQIAKLKALIADKRSEMDSLKGQIDQLEGSVLEREMIYEIQAKNTNASGDSYKRFEELHMKRKLQTLVGMQTQEIGLLREELDRLRRRTFPTFTHIDHRQIGDA